MQSGEPNWAEVDVEAEMDYASGPGLLPALGKLGGAEDPELEAQIESNDPAVRQFLNELPNNGPYRIMICNLPQNITKESLESELRNTYKITAAVQYRPGQHYCFLKFNNRSHCMESTSLFAARIHGAAVKLKVSPSAQQAEIRRANTRTNSGRSSRAASGSTSFRFKNLARDGTSSRGELKKHRHPVGGSIRKTKLTTNRNNQSSYTKPPTNPWNSESRSQPKSDYKILARGKQPTSTPAPAGNSRFSRNSATNVSSGPSRREETRSTPQRRENSFRDRRNDRRDDSDGFRRNDRRDDRNDRGGRDRGDDSFNYRNRGRKMREEDGRADEAVNWRRGGTSNASASSSRPKVERKEPVREAESNFSRRAMNSTQRKTKIDKEKEKEAEKTKNRFTNKFALLDEEDDD